MKYYNEIIGLHDAFSPFYNLDEEREGYWREFIPNAQFYSLLENVLDSIDSSKISDRKSFWIHGTYGTGKSHAAGVIKNLLFSPIDDIKTYIEHFNREDLKHRILSFRSKNSVFPVVMYGSSNITNHLDVVLEIEKAFRKSIEINNINLAIKTDFDTYIDNISTKESINWNNIIMRSPDLKEIVNSTQDLVLKLRAYDKEVLYALRNELAKQSIRISTIDFQSWAKDVIALFKHENIAQKIIIYWDEFTSVMDTANTAILTQIQKIAEMSETNDLFLYIISHRTQRQGENIDDRKHLLGRFYDINYQMSDITTYHLISNYIKKNDQESWQVLRNDNNIKIINVIDEICEYDDADSETRENICNLFPIHPFTAYISSLIAREIGSTERSIFKFLNDTDKGFKYFISTQPDNNEFLLTADYVFDFFLKDFEEEGSAFNSVVINRYKYEKKNISDYNPAFLALFKGLLLLNIGHRILNISTDSNYLVIPNSNNLSLMFSGSSYEKIIDDFLLYIHENKIIFRDHQDRFIVETSALNPAEIKTAKNEIENTYSDIEKIITHDKYEMLFSYWKSNHRRKDITEIILSDSDCQKHDILKKITKFKKEYTLKIYAFIARSNTSLDNLEKIIESLLKEEDGQHLRNLTFVIIKTIFSSSKYDEYIDQLAREKVARKRNFNEESLTYKKNADKIIDDWINNVSESGFIKWFMKDENSNIHRDEARFRDFSSDVLNSRITKIIYKYGYDGFTERIGVQTAWNEQLSRKTGELFLISSSLHELINSCKGPQETALGIIKNRNEQYITDESLKIHNTDQSLPINRMIALLDRAIKSGEEISLADAFAPFFRPPYGFYKCQIFLALTGFLLRKYRGKFHDINTGELYSDVSLKKMMEQIFAYHCDNNQSAKKDLNVRLGSPTENKLIMLLREIFDLDDVHSLTDLRHRLNEWVSNKRGFPMWLYKYSDIQDDDILIALETINTKIIDIKHEHHNLSTQELKQIYDEISPIKYDLKNILGSSKSDVKKEYFLTFANSIDTINVDEGKYDDLMEYVSANMQEDIAFWNEDKVESTIKDWYIKGISKRNVNNIETEQIKDNTPTDLANEDHINDNSRLESIMKRIKQYQGNYPELISILLSRRPDIIYILEAILNSMEK